MYHSMDIIRTDESGIAINTWEDWGLIPTSRPTFSMPALKRRFIDIPGADGGVDFTDYYGTYFENREGSFEFIVAGPHLCDWYIDWADLYSIIANTLHGRTVIIILEDDPGFYYRGRITVNEWRSDPNYSLVVLDYIVDPYKYAITSSTEDWLWDPFDFEIGVIREYKNMTVDTGVIKDTLDGETIDRCLGIVTKTISGVEKKLLLVVGSRRFSPPVFIFTGASNFGFKIWQYVNDQMIEIFTQETTLSGNGSVSPRNMQFEDCEYLIEFDGSAVVSIDYQEGSL